MIPLIIYEERDTTQTNRKKSSHDALPEII